MTSPIQTSSGMLLARILAVLTAGARAGVCARLLASFMMILSGCASAPKACYRGYTGEKLEKEQVAMLELGDAQWVQIDGMYYVEHANYAAVALRPGPHRLLWSSLFGVSVMVDARMIVPYSANHTVVLSANHRYKLQSDRTTGSGYKVYLWIEDLSAGTVVAGARKP